MFMLKKKTQVFDLMGPPDFQLMSQRTADKSDGPNGRREGRSQVIIKRLRCIENEGTVRLTGKKNRFNSFIIPSSLSREA